MPVKFKVTSKIVEGVFKLYINGLLHIHFKVKELKGIQSWQEGEDWWCVEYSLSDMITIKSAYNARYKWEAILKELDKSKL